MNRIDKKSLLLALMGAAFIPAVWLGSKALFDLPDRILPGLSGVADAASSVEPNLLIHLSASAARLLVGFISGVIVGIFIASAAKLSKRVYAFLDPVLSSLQSVPPLATVPFFILWFGFSELGKFLIVFIAVSVNLARFGLQTLSSMEEKFLIMKNSYRLSNRVILFSLYMPYLLSMALPTVRYMLAICVGIVLFSELLGAQLGLGYLIQTSRSTFSMSLVMVAALLATVLYVIVDRLVTLFWNVAFPWSPK